MSGGSRHGRDNVWHQLNVLEPKAGDGCFVGGDFFRGSLVENQLAIVDGGEGESRDIGSRECVSNYIVFSADVMHVCGKLADERQVASLTGRLLSRTGDSKSEGLMISKDSELAALNVVAKVFTTRKMANSSQSKALYFF